MFSKLTIRNIPTIIYQTLEALAQKHDRSLEAEARQALKAWAEPSLIEEERNSRRSVVAERLQRAFGQINAPYSTPKLRPSHVAQRIGEERAGDVEDWFLGEQEPTFNQLEAVAMEFGVRPEWLQHGDGSIYPVEHTRTPEDPRAAVQWLVSWEPTEEALKRRKVNWAADDVVALYLVRSLDKEGSFAIVKESRAERFVIYRTPIHISEVIGAGGEAALAYLFITLEALYKTYTKNTSFYVTGCLINPEEFTHLINGNSNPKALLGDKKSTWWEDIWDKSMSHKNEYWSGWKSLTNRIQRVVAENETFVKVRESVAKGAGKFDIDFDNLPPLEVSYFDREPGTDKQSN